MTGLSAGRTRGLVRSSRVPLKPVADSRWAVATFRTGDGVRRRKPNVRRSVLDDAAFEKLLAAAESQLKPIILVAYDTGMRLREVLGLRWSQVNLKLGVIKLSAEDTKTEEPRTVFLTSRVRDALEAQPRHIKSPRRG